MNLTSPFTRLLLALATALVAVLLATLWIRTQDVEPARPVPPPAAASEPVPVALETPAVSPERESEPAALDPARVEPPAPAAAEGEDRPLNLEGMGRSLLVRVLDGHDAPVSGATIRVQRYGGLTLVPPRVVGTTDENGEAALDALPWAVSITAIAAGFAPSWDHFVRASEELDTVVVRLDELGGSLVGRVIDELGSPVPDVDVTVARRQYLSSVRIVDGRAARPVNGWRARTGADGAFAFPGLPADALRLSAVPDPEVNPDALAPVRRDLDVRRGEEARVELVLPAGARLEGFVRESGGAPAVGAVVRAGVAGWVQLLSARDETDESGAFALHGLPAGSAEVEARTSYGTSAWAGAELVAGQTSFVELGLSIGTALTGRVVDPGGQPVSDGYVIASHFGGGPQNWARSASLDEDGSFGFPEAPTTAGTFHLEVRGPEAMTWHRETFA